MMKVYVADNPAQAHLVKGMLESHGIRAAVQGEALWGTRGETPVSEDTLPTVWILDDDQEGEAVRLVEEYSS